MDIEKAYDVLHKHYKDSLKEEYKKRGCVGTQNDTVREHKINADLLEEKKNDKNSNLNKDEINEIDEAKKCFEELYKEERCKV